MKVKIDMRPEFTAEYICHSIGLGVEWHKHVKTLMDAVKTDTSHNLYNEIHNLFAAEHRPTASEVILTLLVGIRLGALIIEERSNGT